MDQGLGEDTVQLDAENDAHVQYKYSEQSLKPENCETLESQEEALQHSPGSPECSFDVIADILGGKNVENETDKLCSSPNVIEDVGDMVEELTVQNCDGSNIAIVGTSKDREKIQHQQKQFRNVFQLVGGSKVMGSSGRLNINSTASNLQAETSNRSFPEFSAQKSTTSDHIEAKEQLESVDRNAISDETLSSGGIKTKILSKSGFSKFFVKTTLKGKGIICNGPPQDKLRARSIEQKSVGATSDPKLASNASIKIFGGSLVAPSDASLSLQALTTKQPSLHVAVAADRHRANESEGLSLREWLKSEHHKINKTECLYVFRQIVDLVDHSHSQGVVLYDLRPSCFKMLKANRVRYTGSSFQRDTFNPENPLSRKRQPSNTCLSLKKQKLSDNANFSQWPLFRRASIKTGTENVNDVNVSGTLYSNGRSGQERLDTADHPFGSMIELSEQKWYASPEELGGGICTMHTNVFKLGILLFELLARFGSERAHAAAMSDLRHRILPPSFLSENPREAGFCLWLLHPEPSCRPTTRDIMQSEVVNGIQEMFAKELSSSIEKEDTESELLLHFLSSLQEHKEKHASNLRTDILCLEDDIKEVEKRRSVMKPSEPTSGGVSCPSLLSNLPGTRLFKNINQLESVYFSMRTNVNSPEIHRMMRPDIDLLRNGDNYHSEQDNLDTINSSDRVGAFFDGLCKYARYSKFEMRGLLRTGEFSNSANVICSLSFDRDEDYFAAAGISKKIKVYEFGSIFHDSVDIHYPAIEMPNRSRLSGVCWNNYIKNYLASSDYDGIVKLWDVTTGQAILQLSEHVKRAWSVDFSQLYPTKLASGSDDCTVKLWNINERNCSGTIRNIANVCCVQFSPHSTNLVAFGSADYRTYCYDLRNLRVPWCILTGHDKAVSYVKFLDHETLITASTDNTLKLWDLKKTTHGGLSTNACSLTFRGHTNEKNFVGLSVKDGYVACGSETNEVYGYHRSLPMPVSSYKFGSIDPVTGRETDDDNGQFVSSVCWRQKSDMVLAANSSGCIKVLQMV